MSTENNTFTVWAGVGARIVSCRQCEFCLNSQENMCQGPVTYTYQSH